MVNPIKAGLSSAFSAAGAFVSPLVKATNRAIVDPATSLINRATSAPSIDIPDPQLPAPAITPNAKPSRKGQQQSFLSGVAGSGLNQGGGSSGGKSLLGQ